MRNGNVYETLPSLTLKKVLTVPMRNGNLLLFSLLYHFLFCSYRTYEEWKPSVSLVSNVITLVLTVPMRNGNPNNAIFIIQKKWPRSYRTYEEWKLLLKVIYMTKRVSSYRTYEEWKPTFIIICKIHKAFLPYLWGMETDNLLWGGIYSIYQFLPYLWGMETTVNGNFIVENEEVLTVPMRNGNNL